MWDAGRVFCGGSVIRNSKADLTMMDTKPNLHGAVVGTISFPQKRKIYLVPQQLARVFRAAPGMAESKGAEEWREGTDIYRSSLPSLLFVAAADNGAFPNSLMEVAAAGMYYRLNCEILDHIFHRTLDV